MKFGVRRTELDDKIKRMVSHLRKIVGNEDMDHEF
jgi:hypothetical protein